MLSRPFFVILVVALPTALTAQVPGLPNTLPPAPNGFTWQAVPALSDEFNGSQLDRTKWLPYQPYWTGRLPSLFNTNNVMLTNGLLLLVSTPLITNLALVPDLTNSAWVNSACVSSVKPIATYGYYEARVKASHLPMSSSFWFQGKYSEIDVVEEVGASITHPTKGSQMCMNSHYFINGWSNDVPTPSIVQMATGSADEFHTYGVWWKDANTLLFYQNGTNVAQMTTRGGFLEPMYMFFDTEVFNWEGLPTLDSLNQPATNTMYVDWVHAYSLVAGEEPPKNLKAGNPP